MGFNDRGRDDRGGDDRSGDDRGGGFDDRGGDTAGGDTDGSGEVSNVVGAREVRNAQGSRETRDGKSRKSRDFVSRNVRDGSRVDRDGVVVDSFNDRAGGGLDVTLDGRDGDDLFDDLRLDDGLDASALVGDGSRGRDGGRDADGRLLLDRGGSLGAEDRESAGEGRTVVVQSNLVGSSGDAFLDLRSESGDDSRFDESGSDDSRSDGDGRDNRGDGRSDNGGDSRGGDDGGNSRGNNAAGRGGDDSRGVFTAGLEMGKIRIVNRERKIAPRENKKKLADEDLPSGRH